MRGDKMRVDHARRVFATLMQKARKGNLTEKDRETLSRARQTLRVDKRSSTRNPMRVRRTFSTVKRELALLGITIRKGEFDPDEYIVNYRGGKEATAAYTNDLDDAYHTGVAMTRERKNPRHRDRGGRGRWSRVDMKQRAISEAYPHGNKLNRYTLKKGDRVYYKGGDDEGKQLKGTVLSTHPTTVSVEWDGDPQRYEVYYRELRRVQAGPKGHLPNPQRGVVLYGRVLQIKAQKSKDSRYPGERFYHNFKTGAVAYGLPNGDILIRKEK